MCFSSSCVCVCQDSAGRSTVREQHFTLEDDLTPSFGFVQSFILLTDHYILGRVAFIFMMLLNIGVLLAFRFLRVPSGRGELSDEYSAAALILQSAELSDDTSTVHNKPVQITSVDFNGSHFWFLCAGLASQACMSLHLVSKMDTFYYSLLLFNLCTALGGSATSCTCFCLHCTLAVFALTNL